MTDSTALWGRPELTVGNDLPNVKRLSGGTVGFDSLA